MQALAIRPLLLMELSPPCSANFILQRLSRSIDETSPLLFPQEFVKYKAIITSLICRNSNDYLEFSRDIL